MKQMVLNAGYSDPKSVACGILLQQRSNVLLALCNNCVVVSLFCKHCVITVWWFLSNSATRDTANKSFDLEGVLSEIRNLRAQLERSVASNNMLHQKLDQYVENRQADPSSSDAFHRVEEGELCLRQHIRCDATQSAFVIKLCFWCTASSSELSLELTVFLSSLLNN